MKRGGAEDRRREQEEGRAGPLPLPTLEVILYLNEKLRGIAGDHVIHH